MNPSDDHPKTRENPSAQAPVEGQRSGEAEQTSAPRVSTQEPAEGNRETVEEDQTSTEK